MIYRIRTWDGTLDTREFSLADTPELRDHMKHLLAPWMEEGDFVRFWRHSMAGFLIAGVYDSCGEPTDACAQVWVYQTDQRSVP